MIHITIPNSTGYPLGDRVDIPQTMALVPHANS